MKIRNAFYEKIYETFSEQVFLRNFIRGRFLGMKPESAPGSSILY